MSVVGQREIITQQRVISFFTSALAYPAAAREALAVALDSAIRSVKKANWRGNTFKEREVRGAIKSQLGDDEILIEAIFDIVKNQRDY